MKNQLLATLAVVAVTVGCGGGAVDQASVAVPEEAAVEAAAPETAEAAAAPAQRPAPAPAQPRERAAAPKAVSPSAPAAPTPARPEFREVTIPAGTALTLTLASAVASDSSEIEDLVKATLRSPVRIDDQVVLPAGAELIGRVTDAERAGRVKGRARVAFRFTTLLHDADEYDVRTELVEKVAAASKGDDAKKIGIGAGAGAALGAVLGGGSGAAKGAAIGGAAGTGVVLATRGDEVRLEPGDEVGTQLARPLAVRVRVPN